MKQIELTQGYFALVDAEDYDILNKYLWHVQPPTGRGTKYYAIRTIKINGKRTTIRMHMLIMPDPPEGYIVDHQNGNGLDNTRKNLRYSTNAQNIAASNLKSKSKTGYRRVYYQRGKYTASISRGYFGGGNIHLGTFTTAEDAARAYDKAAKERYGEFATLNFPK